MFFGLLSYPCESHHGDTSGPAATQTKPNQNLNQNHRVTEITEIHKDERVLEDTLAQRKDFFEPLFLCDPL
jgi:hypothetical protein